MNLRTFLLLLLLSAFATSSRAAFVIKASNYDSATAYTSAAYKTAEAAPRHRHYRSNYNSRSNLSRLSYWLSLSALLAGGAFGLAIYIGLLAGVAAVAINVIFILIFCVGLAGFITGIVALAQRQQDRRYAVDGVILGALFASAIFGTIASLFMTKR